MCQEDLAHVGENREDMGRSSKFERLARSCVTKNVDDDIGIAT
jgi:hypothetical protein